MNKAGASSIIKSFVVLAILALITSCGGGGGSSHTGVPSGENTTDPNSVVTFTYTLEQGHINSLPAEADHVKVVIDNGQESTAEITSRITVTADSLMAASAETSTLTLTFSVDPGDHTYTVYALKDSTVIATIGPITFTKGGNIPLAIPMAFAYGTPPSAPSIPSLPDASGFDNPPINDTSSDVTQTDLGTTTNDLITQYSNTGYVTQSATGGGGNDWILQVSSGTGCQQSINFGAGNSTAYQFYTGNGASAQGALGVSSGIHTFIQVGGQGVNSMSVNDSANVTSAHIEQYGGPAGNTMEVYGSAGDDTIYICGGDGNDTLTINTGGLTNYTIKDGNGNELVKFGTSVTRTIIMMVNVETVKDENGNTVWPKP
jgi:hypothetical protein